MDYLHVFNCKVFENLTIVHVPDCLVVPDFTGQQNGAQRYSLPGAGRDVHLRVGEESLQVHQGDDGALCCQLGGVEESSYKLVNLSVIWVIFVII